MGNLGNTGRRRVPSPALAISVVALFVALSGTAIALQARSVGPKHLKQGAVGSKHVKDGGLKGRDVKAGSLTPDLFADGATAGARGYATVQSNAGFPPQFVGAHPGLASVTRIATGRYCLTGDGISPQELRAAVAGHFDTGSEAVVVVRAGGELPGCDELSVSTVLADGSYTDFADFNVVVP